MGDEPMNAPNIDVAQRGEVNEQHQNVAEPIVQRNPVALSTIHQENTTNNNPIKGGECS
jgi:hypothetical protein